MLDNASAEFTFLVRFFAPASITLSKSERDKDKEKVKSSQSTPVDSPVLGPVSDAGRSRSAHTNRRRNGLPTPDPAEGLRDAERIWNEVFSSALEYTTAFVTGMLAPTPPNAVSLLTMIRLNDKLIATADARGAIPLVSYLTQWKMLLWPAYRRAMDQQVESLKALADQAEGKGLAAYLSKAVKDGAVRAVAVRYAALFASAVALADEAEDQMVFSR